jgi:ribosome-associated translation inhibitor RaiA
MSDTTATVHEALRLGGGVEPAERDGIVAHLASLDSRLRSFPSGAVELQLTIKERGTPSQRTTLEAWIARQPRLVATSTRNNFDQALTEVRDDLVRQITDAKNRTEPRNSRQRRDTTP